MQESDFDLEKPNRRLRSFLERVRIEHIDLLDRFKQDGYAEKEQLYFPIDGHWNVSGNDAVGSILAAALGCKEKQKAE